MATGICASCKTSVLPSDSHCPGCGIRLGTTLNPANSPIVGLPTTQVGAGQGVDTTRLQAGLLLAGRYRLVAPRGAGNMGQVWRAVDVRLHNRPCAIKLVMLATTSPEERALFEREAETLANLSHQYICDIRDWFEEQGNGYLVLELIQGRTLAEVLTDRGAPGLPEAEVLEWARQLADALAYLHGRTPAIIFRDLKPQNIMLRDDGRIALIDFGIARSAVATGGTTIGTPGYAPPEQYQGIAEPRSDQYALAATLHHLLTGRDPSNQPPFQFPPVLGLVQTLSSSTDLALNRALSMKIDDRYPDIAAFIAALSSLSVGNTIGGPGVSQPGSATAQPSLSPPPASPIMVNAPPAAITPPSSFPHPATSSATGQSAGPPVTPHSPQSAMSGSPNPSGQTRHMPRTIRRAMIGLGPVAALIMVLSIFAIHSREGATSNTNKSLQVPPLGVPTTVININNPLISAGTSTTAININNPLISAGTSTTAININNPLISAGTSTRATTSSSGSASGTQVSFKKDIAAIFTAHCSLCHLPGGFSGGLSLDSYSSLQKGVAKEDPAVQAALAPIDLDIIPGPIVKPGDHAHSLLWETTQPKAPWPGGNRMPSPFAGFPAGPYLTAAEEQTIATWIDQGAKNN